MTVSRIGVALSLLTIASAAIAHSVDDGEDARAHYIANMGVMIERGDTKVLFDPLFKNDYDTYDLPTADVERAILAGEAPWDGIDAVFISHHHDDHFDPASIRELLRQHQSIQLFGPQQAASAVSENLTDESVLARIHGLELENGEVAQDIELGSLLIEAVRVPHGGWPNRHADVENIIFRVTLDEATTVMHFGDADAVDDHYAAQSDHWQERRSHLAMPPFWFFLSPQGRQILDERMAIDHAVGMHVPAAVPDDPEQRPPEVEGVDLFTRPGETRTITSTDN